MLNKIILIFIFISSITLLNGNQIKNKQANLDITLSLVSAMSDTVHSLQQERGASCGYVSSNGKKFNTKLELIKTNSNKKIKKLHDIFTANNKELNKYFQKEKHQILDDTFDKIYKTRKDVINLRIDFSKVYSKYTQTISLILMSISDISESIENKELSDNLYNYSTLLMHKESIGQKRASLSALFSKDIFSKEIFEYYLSSNIQEHIYLKSFLHNVDKNTEKIYHKTLDNISVETVKKYEKLALDKLAGKKIIADAEEWFISVTKKINLIQSIEYKLFQDIIKQVDIIDNLESLNLTKEEKAWIKTHTVKVGIEQWMPVVFSNNGKDIDGICGDLQKKLLKKQD